jgi:hypothetical protein
MMTIETEQLATTDDLAELLSVGLNMVYRLAEQGKFWRSR